MNLKQNLAFFCFIALVSTAVGDQQNTPPRITDQPVEDVIFFRSNMPIGIPCLAEGASPLNYTWKMNGTFLKSGYNSTGSDGKLIIDNPTKNHTGEYQCFVQNKFGTARSNSVLLRKFDYSNKTSYTATPGKPFNLTCNFTDLMNKKQNYWIRKINNSKSEKIENDRMTLDPNGILWISNIATNDSGSYRYIVPMQLQNNFSHEACQIELDVSKSSSGKDKSDFNEFQLRYVSNETAEYAENNKSKKLYCIYDGSSSLKTVWKMNGTSLNNTTDVALGKSKKYLEIKNFQRQNESTIYSCEVTDVANKKNKTHKFNVTIGKPYFTQEPPQMQKLNENDTAEFDCKYAGVEYINVEWTYNGKPIRDAKFYKSLNFSNFNDCAFNIKNAAKHHTGNYGFNISNEFGSVYKDVYLLVKDAEQTNPTTDSTEIKNSTPIVASTSTPEIPDSDPENTTKLPDSTKPTDGAETGKVVTIVLVIASIILSIIVIFLIVMKCKTDSRYNEYELADHDHEANLGTAPELNPRQMQPESSTNHSDSNHPDAKKRRGKHTKNNNATAE